MSLAAATAGTEGGGLLVIAESIAGRPVAQVYELLGIGRRLAAESGASVDAVVMGDPSVDVASALFAAGADRVFALDGKDCADLYQSDVWLTGLQEIVQNAAPRLILAGHTSLGGDLAPRLAFRHQFAIATGCEQIALLDNEVQATRPCYGHKAREVVGLRTTPSVVTVRAKCGEPLEPNPARAGQVLTVALPRMEGQTPPRIVARQVEKAGEGPSLENAQVVIAGGRGLGGPEGFQPLLRLAEVLEGAVGASRVACDLGWCPRSWQIGLTGKTVTPDLYVAVGISGASHHMAGCGNAKNIVAINSDADAGIFKDARYGIVGDFRELIPALVDELLRRKKSGTGNHSEASTSRKAAYN